MSKADRKHSNTFLGNSSLHRPRFCKIPYWLVVKMLSSIVVNVLANRFHIPWRFLFRFANIHGNTLKNFSLFSANFKINCNFFSKGFYKTQNRRLKVSML